MTTLARAAYRDIPLYTPDKTPVAIDLRDNTNLWGVPPAAAAVIAEAARAVARYPTLYSPDLKRRLAAYLGHDISPEAIIVGCGSDEVLGSAIRALANPGDRFAHLDPTFPMAVMFAQMAELTPVGIPLTGGWDADADAIVATQAGVTYLCSPNNPTGSALSRGAIEKVVAGARGLVIVDEAYAEFAGTSAVDLARDSDHVLVTRTLSKAFGLAGLRIGYGIGAPELVRDVEKARGPYTVNALAERAAVAALASDMDWIRAHVAEALANRQRFAAALGAMGLPPLPSAANFLLVPVRNAAALTARLFDLGVGVRPYRALARIGDAVRITIGPWAMLEPVLEALRTAQAEGL